MDGRPTAISATTILAIGSRRFDPMLCGSVTRKESIFTAGRTEATRSDNGLVSCHFWEGRKAQQCIHIHVHIHIHICIRIHIHIYICNIVPSNIILVSLLGTVPRDSWKYVDRTLAFSSCDSTRLRTVFNLCQGRRCGVRICTGAFEFTGDTWGATNHGSC